MSSYLSARQELAAVLEAEWPVLYPGKPIYYENGPAVDPAQQGDLYLYVAFHFNDADLAHIGNSANMGYSFAGTVYIDVSVPLGSGMNKTYAVADALVNMLKARSFASFFIAAPVLGDAKSVGGRCVASLAVPLRSHVA